MLLLRKSARPEQARFDKRYETLGVCMTVLVVLNRLIVALDPHMELLIEDETRSFASQILTLEQEASATNARAGLFMAFKRKAALATLASESEWRLSAKKVCERKALGESPVNGNWFIGKSAFEYWCHLQGRNILSSTCLRKTK